MTTSRFLLVVLTALAAFAMGCAHDSSTDRSWNPVSVSVARNPQAATVSVGPNGGVVSGDGAVLTIPAGALTETVLMSITRVVEGNREIYQVSPAGTTFATAAGVTLPKPANAAAGHTYHLELDNGGTWLNLGGVDEGDQVAGRVSVAGRMATGEDELD